MSRQRKNIRNSSLLWLSAAFVLILMASACGKAELYHGLTEKDANEILVALQQSNVPANKIKQTAQNVESWTIQVQSKEMAKAQQLLVHQNLPRPRAPGLEEICKEKGLIPTPAEEKCRYMLGKKGEIKNALMQNIPEVVDVDAILSIPEEAEFPVEGAEKKRPSASIVVKLRPTPNIQQTVNEAKIQRFVANAVEGLDPRDVTVILTYIGGATGPHTGAPEGSITPVVQGGPAPSTTTGQVATPAAKPETVKVAGIEVAKASQTRLKVYIVIFMIILILISLALLMTIVRSNRLRQHLMLKSGQTVDGQLLDGGGQDRLGPGQGE